MQIRGWKVAAIVVACVAAPALALATQGAPARSSTVQKVTVTGCVERAELGSLSFVLVKAEEGKADDPPVRPPDAPTSDIDKSYRLDVDVDTINVHVGHRVEIVGVMPSAVENVPVGTSGTPSGAPPPLLKVESVKMLSSTCAR